MSSPTYSKVCHPNSNVVIPSLNVVIPNEVRDLGFRRHCGKSRTYFQYPPPKLGSKVI